MSKIEEITEDEPVQQTTAAQVEAASSDSEHDEELAEDASSNSLQSRAEQKSRKLILKLGLKQVPSINRVVLRRPKNIMFVIAKPEVYKSPNSDTYIVFGEAKIEDMSQQAALQQQAQQQAQEQQAASAAGGQSSSEESGKKPQAPEEEDEDVDETGVEAKDIDLVIEQTQCSRGQAVKSLKKNKGDIVNAIMDITL
ncbi:NAC domain-domain-containing protein [Protomyces lactucae-debilis]|uniref:Nascent polypeptide-associated complex subunit alpha n=1 Tax=Protomyces lactucae-debilis TaxID=2754530 RepID=A0A1Y2FW60_PROLT|nr:NAC domain-containing protein [Protomyces lactucae-debilis]ORY86905.1 NAC domain-domain-containing protein [Protomyces lactucae-debilis]